MHAMQRDDFKLGARKLHNTTESLSIVRQL